MPKSNLKTMESFINRFAFSSDVDLEYFTNGFSGKPYIERLRIRINYLIKSQRQSKKIYANRKIQTSKNQKKSIELFDELELNYFKTVDTLKDTHHFLLCLLKLHILINKYNDDVESILDNYQSNTVNFTDLILQIDYSKEERYILNSFNRMRNIIIHAPAAIVIEYLSENVLQEFQVILFGLLKIMGDIIEKDTDALLNIMKCRALRKNENELSYVEPLNEFAARYGLTTTEVLQIIKETEHDFIAEIRYDMPIDSFDKKAIIEKVKKKAKEKENAKAFELVAQKAEQFLKDEKMLIVDMENIVQQYGNNYDAVVNNIYDLSNLIKPKMLVIISSCQDKEINGIIKEICFLIKDIEYYILNPEQLDTLYKIHNNIKIAAYGCVSHFQILNNIDTNKYILTSKKECSDENNQISNAVRVTIIKNKIIDIISN